MSSQSIGFRPTSVIKQLPWRLDKKATVGYLLILMAFSLVGWLYLGQASSITSSTMRIEKINIKIEQLSQTNSEMMLEIAQLESINRVETRARELGFAPTPPENIRYLTADNYPESSAQKTATLQAPPTAQDDSLRQTWLDEVMVWIAGNSE